jgi:taurine dioxygenase
MMEIIPTGNACGAEVRGLDLREPLSKQAAGQLYDAWLEHLILFFRDQEINEEEHLRFTKYFGSPGDYMRPNSLRSSSMQQRHRAVMFISNIRKNGEPIGALPDGEMMFHTDTAYDTTIHKATTLYSLEVPSKGGETIFSNQYAVYDALPEDLKKHLDGRLAYTAYEFGTMIKNKDKYNSPEMRSATHPALRRHEETQRISVFVNELMTEKILGLDEPQTRVILDKIFSLQKEARFCYEHQWKQGDLVIWDNRCSLHARRDFPSHERRLMRRVTISGERPKWN